MESINRTYKEDAKSPINAAMHLFKGCTFESECLSGGVVAASLFSNCLYRWHAFSNIEFIGCRFDADYSTINDAIFHNCTFVGCFFEGNFSPHHFKDCKGPITIVSNKIGVCDNLTAKPQQIVLDKGVIIEEDCNNPDVIVLKTLKGKRVSSFREVDEDGHVKEMRALLLENTKLDAKLRAERMEMRRLTKLLKSFQ